MGKRGSEPLQWVLIEAVAITVAAIIIFTFIGDVRDDRLFEQKFLSRDISLMVDTVSSVPGSVTYTYTEKKLPDYSVGFAGGRSSISTTATDKSQGAVSQEYPFYYDSTLSADLRAVSLSDTIIFSKDGGSLKVGRDSALPIKRLCPEVDTKGSIKLLTLDATDSDAFKLAGLIRDRINGPVALTSATAGASEDDRLKTITADTAVVVSVSYKGSGTRVLYAESTAGEKLACLVAMRLGPAITYSPSASKMISKNTKGVGVAIETDTTVPAENVAAAVAEAVREYNG
jgi:hypothetical protein